MVVWNSSEEDLSSLFSLQREAQDVTPVPVAVRRGCAYPVPKQKDLCASRIAPAEEKEQAERGWEG